MYINENSKKKLFPYGFYCIDLYSTIYYDGKIEKPKENKDILNTDSSIMISYLSKDKSLTIKDNSDFEVIFPNILNNNQNIKWININK